MRSVRPVDVRGESMWLCAAAHCREPLARGAGSDLETGRRVVTLRVELVELPSRGMQTFGASRRGAKDHRPRGKATEYRAAVLLPVIVHCPRCGNTMRLLDYVVLS